MELTTSIQLLFIATRIKTKNKLSNQMSLNRKCNVKKSNKTFIFHLLCFINVRVSFAMLFLNLTNQFSFILQIRCSILWLFCFTYVWIDVDNLLNRNAFIQINNTFVWSKLVIKKKWLIWMKINEKRCFQSGCHSLQILVAFSSMLFQILCKLIWSLSNNSVSTACILSAVDCSCR